MDSLAELLGWAVAHDVSINGVQPQRMPLKGVGIVATRPLKAGDVVLEVPTSALRTIKTVRKSVSRKLPRDATVHCLLAADLALDLSNPARSSPWTAMMPSQQDVELGLPLCWAPQLQAFLPPAAKTLLEKQQAKFAVDWAMVSAAFSAPGTTKSATMSESVCRYAWLLVNTRTFYHTTPATERRKLPRDDCLALQPVADLFNHAADQAGCRMLYDARSYTATITRPHAAGEEVTVSYGSHSNDALLVEYGFVLPAAENQWDETCLDAVVLPLLSQRQKAHLEEAGFLGGYVLDARTVCHRTQVALRLLVMPLRRWRAFVEGREEAEAMQAEVDVLLASMLTDYRAQINGTMAELKRLKTGSVSQREVLRIRWAQVLDMVDAAIQRAAT